MDIFTKEKRGEIMSRVKNRDTKPEVALRKALFARGFRYSLCPKKIAGKPDIYLRKYNAAIFFHGCFWHGHDCKSAALPKTKIEFWQKKISSNKARDKSITESLSVDGYRVLIVWGCAFRGRGKIRFDNVVEKIVEWICSDKKSGAIAGSDFNG